MPSQRLVLGGIFLYEEASWSGNCPAASNMELVFVRAGSVDVVAVLRGPDTITR